MRVAPGFALLLAFACQANPAASDELWAISIVGRRDLALPVRTRESDTPTIDLASIARDLDLVVETSGGSVLIRDVDGREWRGASGALVIEAQGTVRTLGVPLSVVGAAVYLPLDVAADLAHRKLTLEDHRALLFPLAAPSHPTVHAPSGWTSLQIPKTQAELSETRRTEGDLEIQNVLSEIREVLPPAHDALAIEVGAGVAQGTSGATEVSGSGVADGVRISLSSFLTYASDGATFRSGRVTLTDPVKHWTVDAGDLLSDVRGVARGVRLGLEPTDGWRPQVGFYIRSTALSATDRPVAAYKDELLLHAFDIRGEAVSDGSGLIAVRWMGRRASVDTFYRYAGPRRAHERGASVSYGLWRGIQAQLGGRLATGPTNERWYVAAVNVPIAGQASAAIERTGSTLTAGATNAIGFQLPIRRARFTQRYQWTDIAFAASPALMGPGARQIQSIATFSPARGVQLSYQLATRWTSTAAGQQWSELQAVWRVGRTTSLHGVSAFPNVVDTQRFRLGVEQKLPHRFRLNVDYGYLPAFQSPSLSTVQRDSPRGMLMLHRSFAVSTPARGTDVHGRVVDQRGEPVKGAAVTLGPYVAIANGEGRYRFPHVPAGAFALELDPNHLPAQFAGGGQSQMLSIPPAGTVDIDLHAIPLHAIHGRVYRDLNHNGQFDTGEGVAGVVMRLQNGSATVTTGDGVYAFYDLPPGTYLVDIDRDRLNATLVAEQAAGSEVHLGDDGRARTGVDFRVADRQKPVIMQKISGDGR